MSYSVDAVSEILREVGDRLVLPAFRRNIAAEEKSPGELVTEVDRAAESFIGRRLPSLPGGSRVVGEEAVHAEASLLDGIDTGWVWLVDPLDGTRNFVEGREEFGTMVALLRDGQTVAGWIYTPALARLAVAELGSGAFIDGARIRLPTGGAPSTAPGMIYTRFLPAEVRCGTGRELVEPTGAASADYPALLRGALSFVLYWRTLSWDHAAGTLLIGEAGGKAAQLDGAPYRPALPREGLLAASAADDWDAVRSTITRRA